MSTTRETTDFWLLQCKNQMINSPEWKEFVMNLQEKIQQLLFKSHVSCLADLSRPEKILLLEQATKNVDKSVSCALHHQLSASMKGILNHYARSTITKENFLISDAIMEMIQVWISSLLNQWPCMKSKISIFFNQPLPGKLRQLSWRHFLHTNQVFRIDPILDERCKPPSQLENEIARNCKQILHEINLQSLYNSTNAFKAMTAMMQNYCSTCGVTSLKIEDYLLTIPFLLANSPFTSRDLSKKMLAILVEEYISFMQSRPTFMLQSNQDLMTFVKMVLELLTQKYPTTAGILSDVLCCSGRDSCEETDSVAEKLLILLKPTIQGMLVAYLNPEALLFVWDQFFICGEIPGLSNHWLKVVIVVSLHFLKNHIQLNKSDISFLLLEKWPKISMAEIQYEVQRNFQQDFQNLFESVHLPTCHSSSDADWFSYPLVSTSQPELKRITDEKQHFEKKRYVQEHLQKKEEETEKQIKCIRDHFKEKSDHIEQEMKRMKEENDELFKRLKKEKETQEIIKIQAEEKISALQVEISWLKSQFPQWTPGMSTSSETLTLTPKSQEFLAKVPVSRSSYAQTRRSVVKDFLKNYQNRIKSSIIPKDATFFGEELEQVNSNIQDYINDMKKTEVKLFQRRLRPGEIGLMQPDVQQKTYDSILSKMEEIILEKKRKKSADMKNKLT